MHKSPRPRATPVPAAYRAWIDEAGRAGLRHALAEAVGDANSRWRLSGLPLFNPTYRHGPSLPPVADPAALYASLHPSRRANGVFYTPASVVDWLVERAELHGDARVLDPACGGGAFLLGVLRATPKTARRARIPHLLGRDLDELAVLLTQALVHDLGNAKSTDTDMICAVIQQGNSLADPWPAAEAVLTNPPFLTRLRELTALNPALSRSMSERFGACAAPYTDVSTLFMVQARSHAKTLGIVLPASVCGARDAKAARAQTGTPQHTWCLPRGLFPDVGVAMVAAVWNEGAAGETQRWGDSPPAHRGIRRATAQSWGTLLASEDEPPTFTVEASQRLGDVAEVDADFRDEYYHLRGNIFEAEAAPPVRVYSSGLIGLGRSEWGEKSAKILGQRWSRPAVRRASLHPRQAARTRELILVATQTPVLEACWVPAGTAVGLTPVLSVQPRHNEGTWTAAKILATLLSPVATAWALDQSRGTALTLDVLKLSAAQLRNLPLPSLPLPPIGSELKAVQNGSRSALLSLARITTAAYGAPPEMVDWWARRAKLKE